MTNLTKVSGSKLSRFCRAAVCASVFLASTAVMRGQFYPTTRNFDLVAGATESYAAALPLESPAAFANPTIAPGILISSRFHPHTWAGVQLSYGSVKAYQNYQTPEQFHSQIQTGLATYLIHSHFHQFQPFLSVGGGELFFKPDFAPARKRRYAGALQIGLDVPLTNPHFGFSLQGQSLWYHRITLSDPNGGDKSWVVSLQPSAAFFVRF